MSDSDKLLDFCLNSPSIIVNTDLDGIFCAAILRRIFKHLEISGFTDSHSKLFYINEKLLNDYHYKKESLFLDLFVVNENIKCIDQHIISEYSPTKMEYKINPNITYHIGNDSYFKKYPFSTSLYIIYLLNQNNIILNIDYHKIIFDDITLCDLLLRCDSSLKNKLFYEKNINYWFNIINTGDDINKIKEIYYSYNNEEIINKTKKIDSFFIKTFNCNGSSEFKLTNDNKDIFIKYINFIFSLFDDNIVDFDILNICEYKEYKYQENICCDYDKIFSLAYVKKNKLNYSIKIK